MKKFLGILFLCLLWSNVGIAAEKEPGTDKKCLYVYERENVFERKFLPKVNKGKGVFITYVGCNKYYDDWSYDYSFDQDIDAAHKKAYDGCRREMDEYNLTGCHLFSIDDVIVWGKDAAFVAKVEKEAKAKLTTKVAKKKSGDSEALNKGCIKLGTTKFNKKIKPATKTRENKNQAFVMYFGCIDMNNWYWHTGIEDDLDKAKEKAHSMCVSKGAQWVDNCHLFSIGDKIVYGDAALRTKVEEKLRKKLAKISKSKKKSGAGSYVHKFLLWDNLIFSKKSPTTFKKLTFNEEKNIAKITKRTVRNSDWSKKKTFRSFSFTAEFEDNYTVKIFVEYEKGNKNFDKAEKEALFFSHMFGQMPYFLREYNDEIYVHNDNSYDDGLGLWWAQKNKRSFHINAPRYDMKPSGDQLCGKSDRYSHCAVVMAHELAHVIQDLTGKISPSKWAKARKLDKKKYASEYAKTNTKEDFAESLTAWIAIRHKSDKISESDLKKFNEFIPNRLKLFDEMNFNMHPLEN